MKQTLHVLKTKLSIESHQAIQGVLLFDKPIGISSNDAVQKVKRLLSAEKAGHTGTLDPFASGLLPICLGEATKFSADLLDADKAYEATARLGIMTTTGDTEGTVIKQQLVQVTHAQVEKVLEQWQGEIQQTPPMYSALKYQGKALYEYAREGVAVLRQPRTVHIHELRLLEFTGEVIKFYVHCSKGSYIRVLAEDVGKTLKCGAHLIGLRRVQVGNLNIDQAISLPLLERMTDKERQICLKSVDYLVQSLPSIELNSAYAERFKYGQRLMISNKITGRVRVYHEKYFLGTAQVEASGRMQPERVMMNNAKS